MFEKVLIIGISVFFFFSSWFAVHWNFICYIFLSSEYHCHFMDLGFFSFYSSVQIYQLQDVGIVLLGPKFLV